MNSLVLSPAFWIALSAGAFAGPVPAGQASGVGILPGFKKGVVVESGERNPYAVIAAPKEEAAVTGVEGARLTAILEGLPVSGLTRDQSGKVRAVLLGDLRLESGAVVPQLIEGQTDELFVQSLSPEEVVIAWRLEAGRAVTQPRLLRRKIDLSPKVEILLPGQRGEASSTSSEKKRATVIVRAKSQLPSGIVPTSGLPPAKP